MATGTFVCEQCGYNFNAQTNPCPVCGIPATATT